MFNFRLKIDNINRVIVALLLVTVLVIPLMTKTIHVYEISGHCSVCNHTEHEKHDKNSEHDCNSCSICQFVLSPFTKTEPVATEKIIEFPCCDLQTPYQGVEYKSVYEFYNLRAPPILS
jgi:hypothetical protein